MMLTLFLQLIVGLATCVQLFEMQRLTSKHSTSMPSFWSSIFKMLKITQHTVVCIVSHVLINLYYALLILIFCSVLFRLYSVISPKVYSNMCSALGLYP